jgi:GNAT superfamily N-acetyltransferase
MLDNPIWGALTTRHAGFALGDNRLRRYPADMAPFLAAADGEREAVDDDQTEARGRGGTADPSTSGETLSMMAADPILPEGWEVDARASLCQMVCERRGGAAAEGGDCVVLGPDDVAEMLELTAIAFPGFFRSRTIEMGAYYGVRRSGRLVAMAGQRLFLDGCREVSGVCTHPEHRGKGFARRLVALVVDDVVSRGLTPFLHVGAENLGARATYEKLGFVARRDLILLRVRRI